jgi:CO dehydrogenase/acetyl-CoA synthase gamma subunit (corrinoid Fe-S protein)
LKKQSKKKSKTKARKLLREPFTGRFISKEESALIKAAGKDFARLYFESKYFELNKEKIKKAVRAGEPERKALRRITRISEYKQKKVKFNPKKDKVDIIDDLGFGRNFDRELEYYHEKNSSVKFIIIDRDGVVHKMRSLKQAKKLAGEIIHELWREADKLSAKKRKTFVPVFRIEIAYKAGTSAPVRVILNFAENNIDGTLSEEEINV